jgi:manganese/iron transport system permease protein
VVIAVVSLTILLAKWKDLLVVSFGESHARSIGLNPALLKGSSSPCLAPAPLPCGKR